MHKKGLPNNPVWWPVKPVFIVGMPRTASKLIQEKLNAYSECCIVHEMHVHNPFHGKLSKDLKRLSKSVSKNRDHELLSMTLNREWFGSYWRAYQKEHEYSVFRLDEAFLYNMLQTVRDEWDLLATMIELQRKHYEKKRAGARHPIHFLYLNRLLRKFPDASVIVLTRPQHQIVKSQIKKKVSSEYSSFVRLLMSLGIIVYGYLMKIALSLKLLFLYGDKRILKVNYEDLTQNPDKTFKIISKHIGVEYDHRMSDISTVYDSSYDPKRKKIQEYGKHWSHNDS